MPALAQVINADPAGAYPSKRVRMLVGLAAGGGTDVMARFFAQKFFEAFGQPFVVENKPGAGGNIAAAEAARSPADGYTLLMTGNFHVINASLYKSIPYDPIKDFAPVSLVAVAPSIIAAATNSGIKSLRDLVTQAKEKPGQIAYTSAGIGTAQHLAMELFCTMADIKLIHVPYSGGGPSMAAAVAGQVPLVSASLPTALPHVRSGRLVALGVTSSKRSVLASDLPTVTEAADLPGYECLTWYGLLAPAGTPSQVVNKLNGEIDRLFKQQDVREKLTAMGFEPTRDTPDEFAKLIAVDLQKWAEVVKASGAKVD